MAGGVDVLAVAPWFVRSRSRDFNGLPFVALLVGCCAYDDVLCAIHTFTYYYYYY